MTSKGYYCLYCVDHFFTSEEIARRHSQRKHPNMPIEIFTSGSENRECAHCKADFTLAMPEIKYLSHNRSCINNPMREANKKGKSFISCRYCFSKFTRKANLKAHVKRYHGARAQSPIETPSTLTFFVPGVELEFEQNRKNFLMGELAPDKLVDLNETTQHDTKLHGVKATRFGFRFSKLALELSCAGFFPEVIKEIFYFLIETHGANEDDLICTALSSEYLNYPIQTNASKSTEKQIEILLDTLDKVIQSYNDLPAQTDLTISFTSISTSELTKPLVAAGRIKFRPKPKYKPKPLVAAGKKNLKTKKIAKTIEYLERKRGYLDLSRFQTKDAHDKACLPLSIAVALHFGEPYSKIKKSKWWEKSKYLPLGVLEFAHEIYEMLDQTYNTEIEMTVANMKLIGDWLFRSYNKKLKVFHMKSTNIPTDFEIFYNDTVLCDSKLQLLYSKEHVGLITSEKDFFTEIIFCETCKLFVKKGRKHGCINDRACHLCKSPDCQDDDGSRKILCQDCKRRFKNDYCFQTHKTRNIADEGIRTVCSTYQKCETCFKTVDRTKPHNKCKLRYCNICNVKDASVNTPTTINHQCFVAPLKNARKDNDNSPIHLIYDIECQKVGKKLVPIMLIVFRCCPNCFDINDPYTDTSCCGKRCHVFKEPNCMEKAVTYMFFEDFKKPVFAIAHFGSGFDSLYILDTLLRMGKKPTRIIPNGCKIVRLQYNKTVCIDSFAFFHARLAKLPELFDFHQRKTFFPHNFHKIDYNGPWPHRKFFPGSKTDPVEFDTRFNEQQKLYPTFNYMKQLETYCLQDVLVLHQAVAKFRSLVLQYANCEPFKAAITLASLASHVFRLNFVKPQQIAILSDNHDLRDRSQSKIGACFLRWIQETKHHDLKFAWNGPEIRFGGYKLDGYVPSKNTAVEFYGCHWHACLNPEHGISPTTKHLTFPYYTYEEANQITLDREKSLLDAGLDSIETYWECQVNKMQDFNLWLAETKMFEIISNPITSIREALYGGRVEVSLPWVEISDKESSEYTIKYKDANHLYPSVMLKNRFPTGHPTIVNSWELENYGCDFSPADCDKYFGVIKVEIMYPHDAPMLFHGVLPFHNKDKKLIFGLCSTCAEENRQGAFCNHKSQAERSWVGTYCSPELKLALENNYRILRVFQILKFEKISDTIFTGFMVHFLKLKFAASGYPRGFDKNDESKNEFLTLLKEKDGIEISPDEMHDPSNIPLKTLAKFLVNALWGKMAENREKSSTEVHFIGSIKEWKKILLNDATNIVSMCYMPDSDNILVETKRKTNFIEPSRLSNAVIGSFVTSYARCRLTSKLLELSHRVLYCDTDSIIYYLKKTSDSDPIITGPFSHQWKDEVSVGIKNFAGLCPKNYIYETNDGNCKWVCKGLSLASSAAAKQFTFSIAKLHLMEVIPELKTIHINDARAATVVHLINF